ncbi:family 20 glycosylhydrolase [Chitinolyticbacter meiyuanensis]|uniref:beta-N-acetylhexosaminidase n=1 Tax=Chitinolyticbacter meiyuanensis TaxID=682798 RepID=A0A7D5C7R1_9NEIS|nr:family 20 glycosylhydrolase [Chitinolyticbacter meiyuanensis]QKX94056.1 NAGase [Chitinolyticbacter meiyuanensis]
MSRPAGSQLKLSWECVSNHYDGDTFLARLTLTNHSDAPLTGTDWALYFNTCRKIKPETVTGGVATSHVNGDLSKLTPTAEFGTLAPGETRVIEYIGIFWVIQETDAPLGFYIVYGDGSTTARAEAIGDPTIVPFVRPEQRNRSLADKVPLATPESRYADNEQLTLLPAGEVGKITPTPLEASYGNGTFVIDRDTLVVFPAELAAEAAFLRQSLKDLTGADFHGASAGKGIVLKLGKIDVAETGALAEAYTLAVNAGGVEIVGNSPAGVFNGIQSLRQLLPVAAWTNPQAVLAVPHVQVKDAPRFAYRGMHLDVGRNFSSKETVLRLLDCMALYKLNQFHFHLTDDEGWRLEIPTLPELTEIGSKRGFTIDERDNLVPCFGSGAEVEGSHGTGYYSRADFIEILKFATARHIEVVPEFDVPGHARSAIKAMNVRYERLVKAGKQAEAEQYLLADFDDASKYESVQLWHDNVICIAMEGGYNFIETVIRDVKVMYDEAGAPWTTLHTGGDEVPAGAWEGSPKCQAFMQANNLKNTRELLDYFLGRYRDILKKYNLTFGGWEEIALTHEHVNGANVHKPNPKFVNANFQPYVWNNVWGWGQEDFAYQLANAGYKVVLCNVTNLYFDLAYEKDPKEPGYYWGGFINTRKAYEFCPLDIYTTATLNLFGHDLGDSLKDKARLTAEGTKNVIGLQGELWAENARSSARVEHLAMPRIIALGERAWAKDPGWTFIADKAARDAKMDADWNQFANRLGQRELARLDGFLGGYGYRVPVPGAKLEGGKLYANLESPGLTLRYTTDGSEPTAASSAYTGPVAVSGTVTIAAFTSTNRRGRAVQVGA